MCSNFLCVREKELRLMKGKQKKVCVGGEGGGGVRRKGEKGREKIFEEEMEKRGKVRVEKHEEMGRTGKVGGWRKSLSTEEEEGGGGGGANWKGKVISRTIYPYGTRRQ